VLPSIVIFFALTGPPLARFTPELITALVGDQLGRINVPSPTYLDAYGQWIKNLSQVTVFALVITYGGLVSSEVKSGTAVFVLTKPVSRTAFVIVKAVIHSAFLALILVVGTLTTWGITAAVFGEAPGNTLWRSSLLWLVLGVLFIALMALLSVLVSSAAGAAGAGLGAYVLLSIGGIWNPLNSYSPAGITGQAMSIASGAEVPTSFWAVTTSLVLSLALVCLAAMLFRRKEL
jgi:ABC-2 type transport system permease protein